MMRPRLLLASALLALPALAGASPTAAATRWPAVASAVPRDAAIEARIERILARMTLAQKVGQMTQPEIKHISPDEVRRYYIGSVLNGGGSWPGNDKNASVQDWLRLAQAYHEASLQTDLAEPIPVIWGTDAVHGHNNVRGATLFPHNIGLGASHNPALVQEIGAAVARQLRATGIAWTFAPTLAVTRDDRWGRSYESFSEDPAWVERLGTAYVRGLQGRLGSDDSAIATAKHFIGDGGTHQGKDQGQTRVDERTLRDLHGRGYVGALGAGAQTVMASFNSWYDSGRQLDQGKMHGNAYLLGEVLKGQMGFDGLVVSDWNGIAQIPGCRDASCPQAIRAGIDLVMVPEDWKRFIANTIAEVERGEIPMARIDDAVRRILRVKLRAGLFERAPQKNVHAGRAEALQARELARRAVRESLVLLKNERQVLPLRRDARVLVVGKSADSLQNQNGGWTLTWQGTENRNEDFPAGETVLAGLRAALGDARVRYSADGRDVRVADYDAVIAVIGETPYAEGNGDIPPSGTLRHSSRHPEDLAVLDAVAGQGRPVVTVFIAGRPLWVNDLLNRSDAFVAAWLPGTEGGGIADVLLRDAQGRVAHPIAGRLPFSWPRGACQTPLNRGEGGTPLFALGHRLRYGQAARLPRLDERSPSGGCAAQTELLLFERNAQAPYEMQVSGGPGRWAAQRIGDDLNRQWRLPEGAERPDLLLSTVQLHTQQDAKRLQWQGPAQLALWAPQRAALSVYPDAALVFDLRVDQPPAGPVRLSMGCGAGCGATLDLQALLRRAEPGRVQRYAVPLACFGAAGLDASRVEMPFALQADAGLDLSLARVRIVAGAARGPEALACQDLTP